VVVGVRLDQTARATTNPRIAVVVVVVRRAISTCSPYESSRGGASSKYNRGMRRALFVVLAACVPTAQPRPLAPAVDATPHVSSPALSAYEFELAGTGAGRACATRGDRISYWVGLADLDQMSSDPLVRQAIAAAALDAMSQLDGVDTLVITRVTTEATSADVVCASLVGRGVRLRSSAPVAQRPDPTPPAPATTTTATDNVLDDPFLDSRY
jgi:hypothetical protein